VKISNAQNHSSRSEWFPFVITDGPSTGVLFECNDCIKKYDEPQSIDKLDEQVFQCWSAKEVKEVLSALNYIRNSVKK
jgi:hypothetical protein